MNHGRIIITGALGHIGSYLIRQSWLQNFQEIVLIDNLSTQRYASLFDLPQTLHYHFSEADILNFNWADFLKPADTIIHLAALTDAENSLSKRDQVFQTNLIGTQLLAQACLDKGAKLIFPSTTSVYGTQEALVDESCRELKPQSPYAESKLKAEEILQELALKGLNTAILRLGTIFGASPGMRFHTAVNRFIWQARWGQPLSVWETAFEQYRPYLDLIDASAIMKFVIEKNLKGLFNVVTSNFTVEQITQVLSGFIPDLKIHFVKSPIMNQLSYKISAAKISDHGFIFQGDLKKAVGATLKQLGQHS